MEYIGTKLVSEILGINPGSITKAIWLGRIPAPEKGPGNSYIWSEADIQRAARAFNVELKDGACCA